MGNKASLNYFGNIILVASALNHEKKKIKLSLKCH